MEVRKCVSIPVHYGTTRSKLDRLDRLTARLTYGISLINCLVHEDTKLDRPTIRKLVEDSDVVEKAKLSAGYVDQCIDKVIWSWKSYRALHNDWEYAYNRAHDRLESARDDRERKKAEERIRKLEKREPSPPSFMDKTSCRIDYRTGKIQPGKGKLSPLWMHISTLAKGATMDVPLNPSYWHLKQLEGAEVNDFEIIRKNGKYYVHISTTRIVDDAKTSSIGGIDQGLNRTVAIVLLDDVMPREELLYDEKRNLLDKYDAIISRLQQAKNYRKLRSLRNKRGNVSIYHDWCLANKVAEYTNGYIIAIGNTRFRQGQVKGNHMPTMRKRVGKWSYSRQRSNIALKRSEHGLRTIMVDEHYTSKTCHCCGGQLTERKYHDGSSWIICHSCGGKLDADINAAYNIALRCRDDRLKVRMNAAENRASA